MNEHDMYETKPDVVTQLFEDAAAGDEFTITRDGKPVAVVIGWEQWEMLAAVAKTQGVRA